MSGHGVAGGGLPPQYLGLLREIEGLVQAGNLAKAGLLAEQALSLGAEQPRLLCLAAFRRLQQDQAPQAVALLERARALAPNDLDVLNALGIALRRAGRQQEALNVLGDATSRHPNSSAALFNKGTVLEDLGDFDAARAAYEAAVAAQPNFKDALARLSYLAAVRGEHAAAASFKELALGEGGPQAPASSGARDELMAITLARTDIESGNFAPALERLQQAAKSASPQTLFSILALIGDCYNGLGNPSAAFEHYVKSKNDQRALFASTFVRPDVEPFLDRTRRLTEFFSNVERPWRGDGGFLDPVAQHVFLVGFPRSGTTLLEMALSSHPKIASIEERETLDDAIIDFIVPPDGLDRLRQAHNLERYRDSYWRSCRAAVPNFEGKVLVDKLPLNSVLLGLIAKLFPNAKILFAIRDPRDVVLSCFRHVFKMNIAMYEFSSLEGTARLYDAVMRLSEVYRSKLDLPIHDYRYEQAAVDFEGTLRGICAFLGVEWDNAVLGFKERALSRPMNTPSAAQVARGLYDGAGQWQAYRDQLAPILPTLEPWVSRFGYAR